MSKAMMTAPRGKAIAKARKESALEGKKGVASLAKAEVMSSLAMTPPAIQPPISKDSMMTLTLKGLDKRGRNAIFTGAAVALRIPVGAFPDKKAPQTWEVPEGFLAGPKAPATPRSAMTKEQRAALPKPTAAERLAKAQARVAALQTKVAAEAAKPEAAQPAL